MTGVSCEKKPFSRGHRGEKSRESQNAPSESDSPIMKAFREYSKELETKHDKYERLVKLSRDINIASKRIIFSIHGLVRSKNVEEDKKKISESLKTVRDSQFKAVAKELVNEDAYQFIRAYMWGIQEFVEALTFFIFVTEGRFCTYQEVLDFLDYSQEGEGGDTQEKLQLLIPQTDYLLGIQDLTGELMRHCIDLLGAGRAGRETCDYGRRLLAAFLSLTTSFGEYHKKVTVARQSVMKMEYACYSQHVRGSELPPRIDDPLAE